MMDHMLIAKKMIGRVKDVHVYRGVAAGIMSDHFLVESRVTVAKEWGNRIEVCRREVVKVEELKKPEKKREYQERLKTVYDRVKEREVGNVEDEWKPLKESLVENVKDVCGSEWWNEEMKRKVEENWVIQRRSGSQ